MKKIALDLDGVVFDSENLYRVYTEIYDTDIHKKNTIIDNAERTFQKRYNWPQPELDQFYKDNSEIIQKTANIMPGADIVIKKLKQNFDLIVVTSRNDAETAIAKEKFKELGIDNIKVFNKEQHKIDRLLAENADYIIDDDPNICMNAAKNNICALYFKNNASNKIEKENVINVNNWGEIYKYLMLSNNN